MTQIKEKTKVEEVEVLDITQMAAIWTINRTLQWVPIFVDYSFFTEFQISFYFYSCINLLTFLICSIIGFSQMHVFYYQTVIHPNLRVIFLAQFAIHQLFLISDVILVSYQVGFIPRQYDYPGDFIIIIAGDIKVAFMLFSFLSIVMVVIERLIATIRISTYEQEKSITIGVIIVISMMLCSIGFAYGFTHRVLGINSAIGLILFMGLPCCIIYLTIFNFNKSRKKKLKLMQNYNASDYTLSIRYQLKENLHVFKTLIHIVLGTFTCNVISTTFLYLLSILNPLTEDREYHPILAFLVELLWALYPVCQMIQINQIEARRQRQSSAKVGIGGQSNTNTYFDQLKNTWK
ncbi:unnamed protein product [Caenorhabditis angaria]|uniref:Uncharacterized protein n=1 Tax=Caenorhabditis angaria TaxID=860376 RepID=A0A9P1N6I2_9PELO|nr:unnamed protein product [Caenorhabditis angaria]